eukprot:scaffold4141_cov63-Phaeocystis_antarctica.AAC.2
MGRVGQGGAVRITHGAHRSSCSPGPARRRTSSCQSRWRQALRQWTAQHPWGTEQRPVRRAAATQHGTAWWPQ